MSLKNTTKIFIKIKGITIEKSPFETIMVFTIPISAISVLQSEWNPIKFTGEISIYVEKMEETGNMALKNQKTAEALEIKHNLQSSQVIYSDLEVSGDCTRKLVGCFYSSLPVCQHQVLPNPAVCNSSNSVTFRLTSILSQAVQNSNRNCGTVQGRIIILYEWSKWYSMVTQLPEYKYLFHVAS